LTDDEVQATETHDDHRREPVMTRTAAGAQAKAAGAPPVQKKSRRDRLIDEAARHLNVLGLTDSSLRDIAAELGISRAALYYYIEDREDLVFQVYRRTCELLARHLGEAVAAGPNALDVVQTFVARAVSPDEPELVALNEMGVLRDTDRETVLALYEGVVSRLTGILEAGATTGDIRVCDYPVVARTILSLILGAAVMIRWPMDGVDQPQLDRKLFADTLTDVLANGWVVDRRAKINPPLIDLTPLRPRSVAGFDRKGLAAAKRDQILLTASRLFNRKGIDGTSLDEIAAELSATKRTLYQYVGDKQAIVSACYGRLVDQNRYMQAQLDIQRRSGVPVLDCVVSQQRAGALVSMMEDVEFLRVTTSYVNLPELDRAELKALGAEVFLRFKRLLEGLYQEGLIRDVDQNCLLMQMPLAPNWLPRSPIEGGAERKMEIAVEVQDVLRLGLKPL
jgi:AcrR family transcriptional regulator